MKHLVHTRGLLRPLIFSSCALAALASAPLQFVQGPGESWLTCDELRARDGSLLPLFEDHYTDVGFVVERVSLSGKSGLAQSDYVDVQALRTRDH